MKKSIRHYFKIVENTNGFQYFTEECFEKDYAKQMILAGKSLEYQGLQAKECLDAIEQVSAIPFNIERGVSAYVHENSRGYIVKLIGIAKKLSDNFTKLSAEDIKNNPFLLPIWRLALNRSGKSNLKTIFGSYFWFGFGSEY